MTSLSSSEDRAADLLRPSGHERVAFHETTDPEVAIVEFDIVGETVRGTIRQAVVYLPRARSGDALLLRD